MNQKAKNNQLGKLPKWSNGYFRHE